MITSANAKGQIVIPIELRRKYGIKAGTRISIHEENGRIILEPLTREYIHSLSGIFKESGALQSLIEERRKDRAREDEEIEKYRIGHR